MLSLSRSVLLCLCATTALSVSAGEIAPSQVSVSSPGVNHWELLANASAPATLAPRHPFRKPSRQDLARQDHDQAAVVKFVEGTGVRLRDARLALVEAFLKLDRAARHGVTRAKLDSQIDSLNTLLRAGAAHIERLFRSTPEDMLEDQQNAGESRTGRELADLNSFYELRLPGKSDGEVLDLLDQLNALDIVEYAAYQPKPAPPPADLSPPTPNLTAYQGHLSAAPGGIDANWARQLSGGRGEAVRIVDVEYGWIADHEDFPSLASTSGLNDYQYRHHGTSAIGVLAAVENYYGMTGIAPAAEISVASPKLGNQNYNQPDALQRAVTQSRPGDIILVEQQTYCPSPDLCPVEWSDANFAVIQQATAVGRIVMVPAANGGLNLDNVSRFGTRFQRSVEDSGSIYVGAGTSGDHVPWSGGNFGSRLDVQGWGENIATLGGCTLFCPDDDERQSYMTDFRATSGATAVVAGAAAIVQGVRKARGFPDFTSQQMRAALAVGATPQGPGANIGPLPDLRDAIPAATAIPAPLITTTGSATSATILWSAVPGAAGYEVARKSSHGGSWTVVAASSSIQVTDTGVAAGRTYLYRVQAYDASGNRSADSNYELATTVDFTDSQVGNSVAVRAKHIVEVRSAVNAICLYAGASLCASPPFTGAALDEAYQQTQIITAADFNAVRNQIVALRSAIGASPAVFRETLAAGSPVRAIHMEDLREGSR